MQAPLIAKGPAFLFQNRAAEKVQKSRFLPKTFVRGEVTVFDR
jgi:hypothetical protein